MLSYNDSLTVLCSSDLQYVSVEDMHSIQCSSSYALCRWWYSREFGIFAQMYEKMKREHFLCTVCYYKNGNGTGSDLVLIVGVLSFAVFTGF